MGCDYYLGSFSSLKHNILCMLNQMEGMSFDAKSQGAEIIPFLVQIERRVNEIKAKHDVSSEDRE